MVYEAYQPQRFNYVLAGLCAALSILGFLVAGVIPTDSTINHGAWPFTGWAIVAGCFAVAAIFIRRALDRRPQLRIDADGIWSRAFSDATVPWDQILSCRTHRLRNQTIVSFDLRNPEAWPSKNAFARATAGLNRATGFGSMGINASFLTGGPQGVIGAVRHFRPDLFG